MTDVYKLPAPLLFALSTNRSMLIQTFNGLLGPEEQRELLRLLADMIRDRETARVALEQKTNALRDIWRNLDGSARKLDAVINDVADTADDL